MRPRKAKFIIIAVVLIMAFTLAACSGEQDTTPTQGATGGQQAQQQQGETGQQQQTTTTPTAEPTPTPDPEPVETEPESIIFGGIEWFILDNTQEGRILLVAMENLPEPHVYHSEHRLLIDDEWAPVSWYHSDLRAFMNGELLEMFTPEELDQIIEYNGDMLFALTRDHLRQQEISTTNRPEFMLTPDGQPINFWLQNHGETMEITNEQFFISSSRYDELQGVRPAMWIRAD